MRPARRAYMSSREAPCLAAIEAMPAVEAISAGVPADAETVVRVAGPEGVRGSPSAELLPDPSAPAISGPREGRARELNFEHAIDWPDVPRVRETFVLAQESADTG